MINVSSTFGFILISLKRTGKSHCFIALTHYMWLCRLYLDREDLDNLHKSKLQRYFPMGFAIELGFEKSSDSSGTYSIIEESTENYSVD